MTTHTSFIPASFTWSLGNLQHHFISDFLEHSLSLWGSLVAQTVKRLPAMRETRVRFLGQEDPLEKELAIHFSTLAWKIPWTEKLYRLQFMGSQRVGHDWATSRSCLVQRKRLYCVYCSGSNHLAIWPSFYSYHSWVNLRTSNPRIWEFSNSKINNNTR